MQTRTRQFAALRYLFSRAIISFAVLFLFIAAPNSIFAQSTDRDRPTPLKTYELKGRLDGGETEYFYSFAAGPGELTVTFDVKAASTNAGAELELLDRNAKSLVSLLAQGVDAGSERKVESVRLDRRQTIVLRFKGIRYGSGGGRGTYSIKLDGAVALEGEATKTGNTSTDDRLGLPAGGTLRIELDDGSAQEINLRRVRRIIVKP